MSSQQLTCYGYWRCNYPNQLIVALVNVINAFYWIDESFIHGGNAITITADKCNAHNDSQQSIGSVFGNYCFMLNKSNFKKFIKWSIHYNINKKIPHCLFIGITNTTTIKNHGPSLICNVNKEDNVWYTGFGICHFNLDLRGIWARQINHTWYPTIFDHIENRFGYNGLHIKNKDKLKFLEQPFKGYIEFSAYLDKYTLNLNLKVFNTSKKNKKVIDCINMIEYKDLNCGFLCISIPKQCVVSLQEMVKDDDLQFELMSDYKNFQ